MLVTLNVTSLGEEEREEGRNIIHTAELVDVIIRCFFFGKGRVGLVEEFRYVAYMYIRYVTYPLLIFEGMMMMILLLLTITCRICTLICR